MFELTPNGSGGWTENGAVQLLPQQLHGWGYPSAGLIFDAAGNLYGTTYGGA